MIKNINYSNKNAFTFIELIIVVIILAILFAMAQPNRRPPRASHREKACFSNLRVIQGAVEMYNMDVDSKNLMKTLDLDILVKGNYLKKLPDKPEESCLYMSYGDLSSHTESLVFCNYHGDIEQKRFKTNRRD